MLSRSPPSNGRLAEKLLTVETWRIGVDKMPRTMNSASRAIGHSSVKRGPAAKPNAVLQGGAGKVPAMAGSATKEELRARVEKLERANAMLRKKNKELRSVALETAEQVDALTLQLAKSDRQGGRQTGQKESA
jgi:hypothetical protein